MVVSTALGPNPHKYVLVGMAGATSTGYLRSVMTLASADAFFQTDVATYLNSCYLLFVNCVASLAVPNVKNRSSYPLVGAQNVFFVVIGALFSGPNFFQGFFPFFVILNTL